MRVAAGVLLFLSVSGTLFAQAYPPGQPPQSRRGMRMPPGVRGLNVTAAEGAIKGAVEQFGADKKLYDRDLEVLRHLRAADEALTDPAQPMNAVQKAFEEVGAAKALDPEFNVKQGVIKSMNMLDDARRSPLSIDFGRTRALLRSDAIGPAERVVARNGARMQEETIAWIRIQEMISSHLRTLSEATGESLRAAVSQ